MPIWYVSDFSERPLYRIEEHLISERSSSSESGASRVYRPRRDGFTPGTKRSFFERVRNWAFSRQLQSPKPENLKGQSWSQFDPESKTTTSSKFSDHIRALLKDIGITSFNNIGGKLSGFGVTEEPKVFMNRSKSLAAIRCILHVTPVGAAVALLVLNVGSHYIGGELSGPSGQDLEKLAALSFAAKLHELLMLASLGAILLTYIRKEIAFGDGLPFGTLFAAQQFSNISFLWSLEMWGSILHNWQKEGKKWFLLSLVIVCTFLGLTVGPSTNNLMKPRLDDWPAGGTTFWINCTKDDLFPRVLRNSSSLAHCAIDNGDLACPAGNWQVLSQNYYSFFPKIFDAGTVPQNITVSGAGSIRSFGMRSRNIRQPHKMLWGNAFTIATTPMSVVADSLAELGRLWSYAAANIDVGRFNYRNDATFKVQAPQPVTLSYCKQADPSTDNVTLHFPALGTVSLSSGPNTADTSHASIDMYQGFIDHEIQTKVSSLLEPSERPSVIWLDDSDLLQNINGTLAAVFTLPKAPGRSPSYFTCTIDSRLANVTLSSTRNAIKLVVGEPVIFDRNGTFHSDWAPIKPTAEWASYLTPQIPGKNDTILSLIARRAGIYNSTTPLASFYFEIMVENILSTLLTNGIGRSSYNYSMVSTLKGNSDQTDIWGGGSWIYEIISKGGKIGPGGNAFDVPASLESQLTKFDMEALVNGYAYSPSGITTMLEMLVLGLYIFIVVVHVGYSIYSGVSSGSWGSAPEIAALAWNSAPTETMANTGAGIASVDVFKNNVRVMQENRRLKFVVLGNPGAGPVESEDIDLGTMRGTDINVSSGCRQRRVEPVEENVPYS